MVKKSILEHKVKERELLLQHKEKKRELIIQKDKPKDKPKDIKIKNKDTLFKAQYLYISKGLQHFSDRMCKIYDLKDITKTIKTHISDPCIFFGMYEQEDLNNIANHKGIKYLIWGGSDIDTTFKTEQKLRIIDSIKKLNIIHYAISTSLYNRLVSFNITSTIIPFNLCDKTLYKKLSTDELHNNDSIIVYNGIRPGSEHIYGDTIYSQVIKNVPEFNYIYSNTLNLPHKDMFRVYKKCFLGIRLTSFDGNANMVQEMGECNIDVIHNGDEKNSIKWKTQYDVESEIRKKNIELFINHIKQYKSILFLCTDYPGYGGAATNMLDLINYFLGCNIKSFGIYIHEPVINTVNKNYVITSSNNFASIFKKYNDEYSFDLIISRNYIDKKLSLPKIPIYFLVPGIFKPTLNSHYSTITTKTEMDKYINKNILYTCSIATKIYVATRHTKDILEEYYNIKTNILCFNYIPFLNKKPLEKKNSYAYFFGVIVSDFNRMVKNLDILIEKLIETNKKIILIGKNSNKYTGPNITNIGLISHEKIKLYYPRIKYVVNDSFYESCSNTLLEAKYYGSTPLQNFKLNCPDIPISKKPLLLVDDNPLTFEDIIILNEYSNTHQIFITSHNKALICKKSNVVVYDFKKKCIGTIQNLDNVLLTYKRNPYLSLSDEPILTNQKSIPRIIKKSISSRDLEYKNMIKDSEFMDSILKLVFCCDRNYILGLITVINSIIVNTKSLDKIIFNICVPRSDLLYMQTIFSYFKFNNFNYIFISFDNIGLDHISLNNDGNHLKSIGNFIRLNIGNIFDNSKIIYIDSDIVFNADIYELSYLKLSSNNIISGLQSDTTFATIINKDQHNYAITNNINLNKNIINTGIYVLNCKLWNKYNIYDKIMKILDTHNKVKGGLFRCFTMSLLNIALHDKMEYFTSHKIVIDLGWKTLNKEILDNAELLDWSGNLKPWLFKSAHTSYWDKYYPSLLIPNKKVYVIISHPLDSVGGAQNFMKYIIDVTQHFFIIFHKFKKRTFGNNVMEFDLEPNLIYSILRKVNVSTILINNASWYLDKDPVLNYLCNTYNCKLIIHNEYSPALRFAYENNLKEIICVNKRIVNKLNKKGIIKTKEIYPLTFKLNEVNNKKKLGSRICFAFVGRFCKYKFISCIINVFKNLDADLLLIGSDDVNYNIGIIPPNVTIIRNGDMETIYDKIDYLILTSVTEGMPCVILEAFNYGIPVIATCVGGIPDIIQDKETGFIINLPFLTKFDNIDYLDNFDVLYDEFVANQSYIEKELHSIILNIRKYDYMTMSNKVFNYIKNIHQLNYKKLILI